jgi:hypothetical protein
LLKTLLKYCVFIVMMTVPAAAQDTGFVADNNGYAADIDTTVQEEILWQRNASAEEWESLTNDSAFSYKNEYEAEIKKQEEQPGWWEKALNNFFKFFASGTGSLIFWLIVFGILTYILVRIFKGDISGLFNRREKATPQETADGQLTKEDLLSADWQTAMQAAVAVQDFRSATRFAFVHVLQLLHQKELITYRIDTTNYEYYRSVQNGEIKDLLKKILLCYEYAWFGRMPVNRMQWEQTFTLYTQLKSKL